MALFNEPSLDKPAPSWSHDLPIPSEPPSIEPYPSRFYHPPNFFDDICLEIHRSTSRIRGIGVWIALIFGALGIVMFLAIIEYAISGDKFDLVLFISMPALVAIAVWGGLYIWRMDTASPRDEPIRFNRARRKVYVYRFHHDGRRPFSRTAWFTRAEVYNWDDLRAEACSIYGPMGSGGLIQTVTLAVVEPGTNKVLDRFHFAHGGLEAEMYWAMAQIYMQQGPEALPKFDQPPRDWNNEKITFNLARYLAPKVKWPEAIDVESRTAPEQTPDAT